MDCERSNNMGQTSSTVSRDRFGRSSFRRLKLSSFYRKPNHNRSMSATFYILEQSSAMDLININTASQEQLMTLPSITREIARNIVKYRNVIGRFKRVDDLALVSGIGADKLNAIRDEICVKDPKPNDFNEKVSSDLSLDSVKTIDYNSRYLDLNKANIFQLQTVSGVTQEIAANILHYRDRKGRFKSVNDLRKVKGIDAIRFSVLRAYFIVDLDQIDEHKVTRKPNGFCKYIDVNELNANTSPNDADVDIEKSDNANNNSPPLTDIFDLLSLYCPRPAVEPFRYVRHNRKAIRVATWNLFDLTIEKAQNLGFLEVCCRTLLENRLSIVAVQDVKDEVALSLICEELNNPKLRRVKDWTNKNQRPNYCYKWHHYQQLGFIYNTKNDRIDVEIVSDMNNGQSIIGGESLNRVLLVRMKVNGLEWDVWNVHYTEFSETTNATLNGRLASTGNTLVLGDFSGCTSELENTNDILHASISILPKDSRTNSTNTPEKINYKDNILLNKSMAVRYTQRGGLISGGLSHLAIPRGWNWGGVVSEHCPVWCELYVDQIDTLLPNGNCNYSN